MSCELNLDGKALAEMMHGEMTMQDVSDTANGIYKVRDEIIGMMSDLTLAEISELCGVIKEWYNS